MIAWITAVPDWDFFLFGAWKGCFFLSQSFSREYSPPERSQVNGGRGAWEKNEKGLKLLASCQRKYRLRWERAWYLRLKVNHAVIPPFPPSIFSPVSPLITLLFLWLLEADEALQWGIWDLVHLGYAIHVEHIDAFKCHLSVTLSVEKAWRNSPLTRCLADDGTRLTSIHPPPHHHWHRAALEDKESHWWDVAELSANGSRSQVGIWRVSEYDEVNVCVLSAVYSSWPFSQGAPLDIYEGNLFKFFRKKWEREKRGQGVNGLGIWRGWNHFERFGLDLTSNKEQAETV